MTITPATYLPRRLSGRLSSGAERGRGTVYHAVPDGEAWGTAACGARPGRRSGAGFVAPLEADAPVTCPRCRRCLELDQKDPNP